MTRRALVPGRAATVAALAGFALAGCSPSEPPPRSDAPLYPPPPPVSEHTREYCVDQLVRGKDTGCSADTDADSEFDTWFVAGLSPGHCQMSVTYETTPAVCVVTEGFEKGATFPVPQAP